eukprot:Tamp_15674.p2 GENE.Tamp_15674~~Tamp_15674.p2  ORF type:complete len:239 (-),score=43.21 Tamp_15674:809-1471(-)
MAAFEEGDRVEFLVKTVAFSRKIMANGMTSTGLTGVVKYIAKPGDPDDLVMLTVAFYKDDGSEAFDHLFAEDELEKVKEEAPQTTTGSVAEGAPSGPGQTVCANVVVASVAGADKMLEVGECLKQGDTQVSVTQHSTGFNVLGTWQQVLAAIAQCESCMCSSTMLSVTVVMNKCRRRDPPFYVPEGDPPLSLQATAQLEEEGLFKDNACTRRTWSATTQV